MPATVGILSFQGDFAKHQQVLEKLRCQVRLIKSVEALNRVDCLIIPGGESSVIARFLKIEKMAQPIKEFAQHKPIWGTCAGMILLGRSIIDDNKAQPLGLIDIITARNAYGRQYESFVGTGEFGACGEKEEMEMVFIRAPKVIKIGKDVEILGRWQDEITIVRQDKVVATAFHPELSASTRFQEFFLSLLH
ncbi:MAG: pyridoxal 5'-phosphate synthase glutaminase subunit PdxT [candidate division Zixibacteria bacterium]|nr:pyridoxal 5'-phosphate synthase glutaminase subunit PdxT [candidate division Zixibacteria bacterium]